MVLSKRFTQPKSNMLSGKLILATVAAAFLFSGCATSFAPNGNDSQANIEAALTQADNELAKGRREQAIALLDRTAKENPTSMLPWLKISNIWFEAGNYPSSILAANEVLERDSSNQEAKSILVVAGLRVAASAARGLASSNSASTNARVEAENLTNSLRAALGEPILVPAVTPPKESPRRSRRSASHAKPAAHHETSAAAESQPTASAAPDPFKSLK